MNGNTELSDSGIPDWASQVRQLPLLSQLSLILRLRQLEYGGRVYEM
jgi:hypothetical protein